MTQVQVEKMGAASEIQHADGRVVQAVERRKRAEAEEVAALLDARALGVHQALGFASFHEYAEARLQLPPRLAYERVRVVEALTTLPRTRAALAAGVVGYSVVRELTRVVTPANELTWLERAAGCTAREVERLVAGHVLGADPDDTPDPAEVLTLVSFELTPATRALLREARQQLHRDAGQRLDDDAFIAELVRRALASDQRRPGTPSYQIAINVCDRCERVTQDGAGQVIDIDPAELHVALCDASIVDTTRPGAPATREVRRRPAPPWCAATTAAARSRAVATQPGSTCTTRSIARSPAAMTPATCSSCAPRTTTPCMTAVSSSPVTHVGRMASASGTPTGVPMAPRQRKRGQRQRLRQPDRRPPRRGHASATQPTAEAAPA